MNPLIEVKNLSISTENNNELVRSVDFELYENEIVGVFGESGSGKTITVKSLIGVLDDDLNIQTDAHKILGTDIIEYSGRAYRELLGKRIGYIPQNTTAYLHPLIRIKHQITEAYVTHRFGNKTTAIERAISLMTEVGLKDPERVLESYPYEISGGMRQRVNIAMSLMTKPDIIIADEPTTALDSITEQSVMKLLQKIKNEHNVSMIFITHNLKLIHYFTDRCYVLYKGEVVESGETKAIFKNPQHPQTKLLVDLIPKYGESSTYEKQVKNRG